MDTNNAIKSVANQITLNIYWLMCTKYVAGILLCNDTLDTQISWLQRKKSASNEHTQNKINNRKFILKLSPTTICFSALDLTT